MKKLFLSLITVLLLITTTACNSDSGLVKVNVDALFFEGSTEEEIVQEAESLGLKFYTIHKDGSVTYEIEEAHYQEILKNYVANLEVICNEFAKGEEKIESFEEINYSDNLDAFNFIVNEKYSSMDLSLGFPFLIMGAYYQNFSGNKLKDIDVRVNFIDQKTNETLDSISFKEVMNAQ